jgi:hypothetical protein
LYRTAAGTNYKQGDSGYMADEQIIYVSPEEELTNVRERLEQAPARRIILVIPPQTQLRSHVGWRVLHAHMRELGKELQIVSADRQIRAVAKAVGFRVADSLESPSNKSRPPSRSGRTTMGGKTSLRPHSASARPASVGDHEGRPYRGQQPPRRTPDQSQQVQQSSRMADVKPANPAGAGDYRGERPSSSLGRPQGSPQVTGQEEAGSKVSSGGEGITGKGADLASSTFGTDDYEGPSNQPLPSPGNHEDRWAGGEEYDFHIETAPPVSPRLPVQDDEDFPDSFIDQYNQAQLIRQQFQIEDLPTQDYSKGSPSDIQAERKVDEDRPYEAGFQSRQPAFEQRDQDPYAYYMEDIHPVYLPEQRGSAPVEDVDTGVPDLADVPTDILDVQIEDLGDEGDILPQPETILPDTAASRSGSAMDYEGPGDHEGRPYRGMEVWDEPMLEEPERPLSRRVYGSLPRGSHSGNLRPQMPEPDIDDEDMLPPVADRPTQVRPPVTTRRSGTLRPAVTGNRGPQPVTPQTRGGPAKSPSSQTKKPAKNGRVVTTSPQGKKPSAAPQTRAQRKNNRKTLVAFLCLVALFLILVGLFYFVPAAQITISLPSRALAAGPLHFSASTNAKDKAHNTIASVVLSYKNSVSGQGSATGTRQVGNALAKGSVSFTNRGAQQVDIPTGIVLSTSNGVEFATTADALIPPAGSNNPVPPVPVQAVMAGNSGNVAAGSITVILSDSLNTIAKDNTVPTSSLNLSVTNPDALTGGGAVPATSITASDIAVEKATLNKELQADANSWLAKNVHKGDISGTPAQTETVTTTPATGNVTKDGKFSETLNLQMTVLVIRAGALQAAVTAQLNAMALKMTPAYTLVDGQPPALSKIKSTASKDGSSISITLDATGQIVQQVSVQNIRSTLVGKTIDQARSSITNGLGGLHNVQNTTISVSPGFLTILPFRADRITIILKAVPPTPPPTKGVPNG